MAHPVHKPRFLGNVAWSLAGNIFYAACQWGILAVLAKAADPRTVGEFALALAISAPVYLFTNLQIRAIQSTDTAGELSLGDYLGLRLLTTAAALIFLIVLALAGYRGEMMWVILAVAAAKAFEAVSDVFHGDLQRRERMDVVAIYLALKGSLSVAAVALAIQLFGGVSWAALSMAGVFALVLFAVESRFRISGARPRFRLAAFRTLIVMALPLGLSMMLISLNTNIPRYFVEHALGMGPLGIFAALSYLAVAGATVINAVGLAATPRLARHFAAGERRDFLRLLAQLAGISAALGACGVAALLIMGRPLLTLIYGPLYASRLDIAIWVMAAATVTYAGSAMGYGLTAARCFGWQLPLFAIVAAITAGASLVLIPRYELTGAAAAQAAGSLAQLLGAAGLLAIYLRRESSRALMAREAVAT